MHVIQNNINNLLSLYKCFFFLFFFFFNQKNVPFWSSKEMVTFEGFDDKLHKNDVRGKISQHYSNAP